MQLPCGRPLSFSCANKLAAYGVISVRQLAGSSLHSGVISVRGWANERVHTHMLFSRADAHTVVNTRSLHLPRVVVVCWGWWPGGRVLRTTHQSF